MKQILFGSCGNPGTPEHVPLMQANVTPGTLVSNRTIWPAAGAFRNFVVELSAAPGLGISRTLTLYKNGATTALTVTITGASATTARITGTDVSVAAGDLVSLELTSSGGTPASASARWSLEFEGTTANESGYALAIGGANNSPATRYSGLFTQVPPGTLATATTNVANIVAAAGTLTSLRAAVNSAPGASNGYTFYVNKNGTRQDGSGGSVNTACALVGAITSASATFSLTLAAGDLVYVEAVVSGTFTTRNWAIGATFVATTAGQYQLCGSPGTVALSTSATQFASAAGAGATLATTETTFTARHLGGVTEVHLTGFRALLATAPGSGKNRLIDLRVTAASTGLSITIADTATSGTDLGDTVSIVDGNLWAVRLLPTGTPAASTTAWAFIASVVTAAPARVTQVAVEVAIGVDLGISLTVDGVEQILDDYGRGLLRATLRLEENLTARTVMSFKLRDPTAIPEIEQTVLLRVNGVRHFGGIVTTITETPFGDGTIVYSLTCTDWLAVADGILINDISPAGTLRDVLEWMLTRLEEFGFTIHPLQDDGPTLEATAYPFQTYTQALTALATSIDRTWRVDPYQQLRVYPGEAGLLNEHVLSDDTVLPTASREITRENHASTVWVRFGSGTASDVTITSPGAPGMVYTPPYIVAIGPNTVNVNGTDYPVLPAPGAGWRWDSTTGELTTDVALTGSDTVIYTVTVAWPSYAVASTVVGTDLYEVAVIVDYPNVFDAARASEIAIGELAKREGFPPIFHVTTVHPWFHAGELVNVDLSLYGFIGEALITAVRLQHVSRRGGSSGAPWWQFDLDLLTSTVIPRANWLDFWRGGAGSGSNATSVPAP